MACSHAERPLLIQTTSHRFTPEAHPTVFRMAKGLSSPFRQVILELSDNAYVAGPLSEEDSRALHDRDIVVHRVDRARLHHEEWVRWALAGIHRRHGEPAAILAQLGNNGWRSLVLAAHARVPLVTLFHGGDARVGMSKERFRERFERLTRLPGSHLGGVSRNIVDDLHAWGVPASQTFVQHHGIDLTRLEAPAHTSQRGALKIVMAGRFVPFKDHATGLCAFAAHHARHPASRLELVGDGPLVEETRSLAAELGVSAAVRFEGLVPVGRVLELLAGADVALQPSRTDAAGHAEGIPTTILEAMALGLPVVATRHAGIPEAVVDGETGCLTNEADADALARALDSLAADPARRLALGAAGRARIEREFEIDGLCRRFADRIHAWREEYQALPRTERDAGVRNAVDGYEQRLDRYGLRLRALLRSRIVANRLAGRVGTEAAP